MIEFLRDLIVALVPQTESNEPKHVFRWRQTVAVIIFVEGVVMTINILWAGGWLVFAGLGGYATTSELKPLNEIRISQIERSIRDAKTANCIAQLDGNAAALSYSLDDLNRQLNAYFYATGRPYPRVPECSELIKTKT